MDEYGRPERMDEYIKVYRGEYGSYLHYPQNENDRLMGGLCYIFGWIVSVISLVAIKPLSPFLRFHAIQALGLHLVALVLAMLMSFGIMFVVGFCLMPFVMGLSIYHLIIGIIVLMGNDHCVPWLGNYVEENYI